MKALLPLPKLLDPEAHNEVEWRNDSCCAQ
jgi:hypothetical protein